jgi:aspartyl-tRNA(Asn)/glutamyl-tRNA(Gln) amidotransferase subunit A
VTGPGPINLRSVSELRDAISERKVSALAATEAALKRARALQPTLNIFTEIFDERAQEQAREIDRLLTLSNGPLANKPLAGVPIALKDNICLSWGKTTCASNMLRDYRSPMTATVAQRLIDAGAIVIGKTNLDEFAMGSSTENSIFGPTRNPWDFSRVPGGSSGGSAAAVSAGIVPLALGSDTGGSIRQPAGFCGVVGLKPSYGCVSRSGLVAYASSLDQIGPFANSVRDAALALSIVGGEDQADATSLAQGAPDALATLDEPVDRLVIGIPKQARNTSNHRAVTHALNLAAAALKEQGAIIEEVDLAHADHAIAAYYIIALAEASSNLARFDGVRYGHRAALRHGEGLIDLYRRSRSEGFSAEVQRRIMLGTHVLSSGYYDAYYATAQRVRRQIRVDFDRAFNGAGGGPACHALLMPVSPGPAFQVGEKIDDPMAMYLEDIYTVGVNLAGLPATTLNAGFAELEGKRLPIGVQLIGPALEDVSLLRVARMLENSLGVPDAAPIG